MVWQRQRHEQRHCSRLINAGSLSVSAAISGTGALALRGSGTLALTGNNSYSGGTTVSNGTLP